MTDEQLKHIMPAAKPVIREAFLPHLNTYMRLYRIITPQRQAPFLATLAHESGQFRYMKEIWGPTKQQLKYERDFKHAWPPSLKDKVNKVAYSLGNLAVGDGKFFMGHGPIQITGRRNHLAISMKMFEDNRLLKNPELLSTPQYGVQAACIFWSDRELNEISDQPDGWIIDTPIGELNKFSYQTYRVNGALSHYEDRLIFLKRAKEVM